MRVCCLLLVFAAVPSVFAQNKIAVIDLNRVMQECEAGKQLQAELDRFMETVRAEAKPRDERMRQINEELEKDLTDEQRQVLAMEFEDQKIKLKRLQDDKMKEGRQREELGLSKIEKELVPLLEKITQEEKYDLLLDISSPLIFYATDGVNITERVISRYDQDQQ